MIPDKIERVSNVQNVKRNCDSCYVEPTSYELAVVWIDKGTERTSYIGVCDDCAVKVLGERPTQ